MQISHIILITGNSNIDKTVLIWHFYMLIITCFIQKATDIFVQPCCVVCKSHICCPNVFVLQRKWENREFIPLYIQQWQVTTISAGCGISTSHFVHFVQIDPNFGTPYSTKAKPDRRVPRVLGLHADTSDSGLLLILLCSHVILHQINSLFQFKGHLLGLYIWFFYTTDLQV